MSISGGGGGTVNNAPAGISFKSYYVNSTILKHALNTGGRALKNVATTNWTTSAKILL
jgi:hypothetical protein